jgi:phosphoribosylformylglycinamidine cyclo-ligase
VQYSEFVDYSKLDPVKKAAISKFTPYLDAPKRIGVRILPETIGESAVALELPNSDYYLAFNVEGLGTKNIIADKMFLDKRGKGVKYFENIGLDNVAMSTNDLSSIGADPFVYGDILSTHKSDWFSSDEKTNSLFEGFRKACEKLGMALPCGETPSLVGIIQPGALDLAGASIGLINPKKNLTVGQNMKAGDKIFGLASSGVHSNGISFIRKTLESLPEGYFTELPSGKIVGEEVLTPTTLYSKVLVDLVSSTQINYMQPITGHGWKKIMRNRKRLSYEIDFVPEKPELFSFLQEKAGISDAEAYYTLNMGVGYVLMAPKESAEMIFRICKKHNIVVWELGEVKDGEKCVKIKPKNVVFEED